MAEPVTSLILANLALREKRWEDAVSLYSTARHDRPELSRHIDFNLKHVSRAFQGEERNPILVSSVDSPPSSRQLASRDVLVIVLATSLQQAGETARLISRRANYRIGVVILLTEPADKSVAGALGIILERTDAKYAVVTSEHAFPGRNWLQHAYESLKRSPNNAVHASTGNEIKAPGNIQAGVNIFATPMHIAGLLQKTALHDREQAIEPTFLLADCSDTSRMNSSAKPTGEIHVLETKNLESKGAPRFSREVCVVMPCVEPAAGQQTAKLLQDRAGIEADIVVAIDTERQGFIRTLNQVARCSAAEYVVYLAEDAWPGQGWLRKAYDRIRQEEKALLAFNCGKWHGRVAAFGMVNKKWAYGIYGDQILFDGYKSHRADNEVTVIARAQGSFTYAPECVLVERDASKDFRRTEREAANFQYSDARLFRKRFYDGFDGLVSNETLTPLHDEYLDLPAYYGRKPKFEVL
jgi:hypothetical protein